MVFKKNHILFLGTKYVKITIIYNVQNDVIYLMTIFRNCHASWKFTRI